MGIFDALKESVGNMGTPLDIDDLIISLEQRRVPDFHTVLESGLEVSINELEPINNHGGLLGYKGAQVLLYLKNQEHYFDQIQSGAFSLPKYHVANCQTLVRMREQQQFERYVVTNDKSGRFELLGPNGRSMEVELSVCKNCLKYLNYRGYRTNSGAQSQIFESFKLKAFFANYSSLFSVLPKQIDNHIFNSQRAINSNESGLAQCTSCDIWLSAESNMLGHISTNAGTERVVCIDCQRKINTDTPQPVSRNAMTEIASARRKKRPLSNAMTWKEVFGYADSAYAGLLRIYQRQGWSVPEPGVDIMNSNGEVCLQLGLAWLDTDGNIGEAVVLDEPQKHIAKNCGWSAMTLAEALLDAQQNG